MAPVDKNVPFFVQSSGNLGAVEIATFLGLVLYGVSLAQGYTYFNRSAGDSLRLKIFVAILLLMESFHSFTAGHTIYYDTVSRYKDPEINSFQLSANAATETLLTFLVQCFFSQRIYRISNKNLYVSGACGALAVLRFLFGVAVSAESVIDVKRTPNWVVFVSQFNWLITTMLAVGAATDILIAVCMLVFLRRMLSESTLSSTTALINRLARWSLQTGSLTSVTSLTVIILFQVRANLVWFGIYIILAKLYSNSLLASLNSRPPRSRTDDRVRHQAAVSTRIDFESAPVVTIGLSDLSSSSVSNTREVVPPDHAHTSCPKENEAV